MDLHADRRTEHNSDDSRTAWDSETSMATEKLDLLEKDGWWRQGNALPDFEFFPVKIR